jgi:hypothetical protein
MEELTGNFSTASNCEAFQITAKILEETLQKAKAQGKKYVWAPLDDDYWLPEESDFNYQITCPNFMVFKIESVLTPIMEVEVFALFEQYQGHQNLLSAFAKVFQVEGEPDMKELKNVAKMYAYLRFSSRDYGRELDKKFWSKFLTENVVSNETVLIFREDKKVAQTWAQKTFPNNQFNAWIGKCGEFVFAGWAGECCLPVSRVDLKPHEDGDEYDFSHDALFLNSNGGQTLKLDIKAFQIESGKSRDWWNVSERCLRGERAQDLIIFVVIDEDFRMGKVIGYLTPKEIINNCQYVSSNEYFSSSGYFRVYLSELKNPYYLRSIVDSQNQVMSGLFFGQNPHEVVEEIVKGYPLDPIIAYRTGRDWYVLNRGGRTNLMAPCSLEMFCRPKML